MLASLASCTSWQFWKRDAHIVMLPFKGLYKDCCQDTLDCVLGGRPVGCVVDKARAHFWGRFYTAFEWGSADAAKTKAQRRTHATQDDVYLG